MHYDRVTVVDHPMVQHKLSKLRNKNTSSKDFRALVRELAMFEGYEATRDLALEDVEVETPICKAACKQVAGKKMVIVPILRAGLGMVEGLQELMPSTFVGHLGMYRDPETHGGARRHRGRAVRRPGRADLHLRHRRMPERTCLHSPRPRRRRGQDFRHQVTEKPQA